jgi:hypothetical protein
MTTIGNIWTSLQKGKEIANPGTWKNRQNTINILSALLGVVLFGLRFSGMNISITDEELLVIATGIATVLGAINSIITTASSAKVGL